MHPLLLHAVCALAAAPTVFLSPADLHDADGVRVEARIPEPGRVLIPKDPDRPKLWYAPVASRAIDSGVRLWYQRVNTEETAWEDQRTLCVGDLRDGKWTLPALHPDPPVWGGPNNVCLTRSPHRPTWGGFNVFQIVEHKDRLALLYWDQPAEEGLAGAMFAYSSDGLSWEKQRGAVFTEHNDAYTLMKRENEFWLYQTMLEDWPDKPYTDNLPEKRRVQAFRTSPDLQAWTDQEIILRPDEQDPPEAEFYLMKAFPYGNGFAGLLMKYYADPALEGKHSGIIVNELIASRDGRAWERPFRHTDLGFWSYADPFPIGSEIHFAIWKDGGMETVAYPKDRLTAAAAEARGGFTLPLNADRGLPSTMNADTSQGWIELDVVDGAGAPRESFGRCRVEALDARAIPLAWKQEEIEPGLKLRVRMERSALYALD